MPNDPNGYPKISVPDLGRVFQAIRDRNCIPFFGAGASMAYVFNGASAPGIPGGWELTLALLREAHVANDAQIAALNDPATADPAALREAMKLRGYDLFKAADSFLYLHANNPLQLDAFLRRQVNKANGPRPIHTVIAQLRDIYTVLTTNYDCLFEAACKTYQREVFKHIHDKNKADSGIWRPPQNNLEKPQLILEKMHGSEELDKSMIITRADYIGYLAHWNDPAKGMPTSISSRLPASSLLFLGYGLADWDFLTIWEGIVKSFPQAGYETKSFAVMKALSPEDRDFLKDRKIEPIECDLTHFAIALAREFDLEIPQLGILKKRTGGGGGL
jgi:hypothetical protein